MADPTSTNYKLQRIHHSPICDSKEISEDRKKSWLATKKAAALISFWKAFVIYNSFSLYLNSAFYMWSRIHHSVSAFCLSGMANCHVCKHGLVFNVLLRVATACYLAPVPLSIFRSNSKFDENSERSSFNYIRPITTIFCTRHDSDTVVTCAKYRCDRPRIFYTRVFWIFIEFRIRSKYA